MSGPQGYVGVANTDIQLFESGNLADATIVCGDRTWKVHKVILGSRCKWFKAAFYGNLAEASSGKIVLEEQDPDLIDILLRFIYAKDIDIPKIRDGKGIPALCAQLFRLGDFFLVDDLKDKAMTELMVNIDNTLTSLEFETCEYDGKNPKWLVESINGLKEAYKDGSTEKIAETLVKFVCTNKRKIFRFKDAVSLLDEIPEMAKDLMKFHIINDIDAKSRRPTIQLGLPVLAAAIDWPKIYEAEDSNLGSAGEVGPPCHLYPNTYRVFEAVDPRSEYQLDDLAWITPRFMDIDQITSHEESDIVRVRFFSGSVLYVRFEDCEAARLYVGRYCRFNNRIEKVTGDSVDLFKKMCRKIRQPRP